MHKKKKASRLASVTYDLANKTKVCAPGGGSSGAARTLATRAAMERRDFIFLVSDMIGETA